MKKYISSIPAIVLLLAICIPLSSKATKHIITAQNFFFSPSNLTNVLVGDTIRWVRVNGSHTTTSTVSSIPAGAAIWNSPLNSVTTSFEYKVTVAGTYNYVCTPHAASMFGSFTAIAPDKVLNLNVLLEGLFNGINMNQAQNATGNQFPGNVADQLTIELHAASPPYAIQGTPYVANLDVNGFASVQVPSPYNSSYYIVIRHRNSIETWSGVAVSFSGTTINYDFTLAASQAFGNNLKPAGSEFLIYACDVNQDGIVDSGDMIPVDNDASNFATGYLSTDANGDGLVDSGDMIALDNNSAMFISKSIPE